MTEHIVVSAAAEAVDEIEGKLADSELSYRVQQFYFYEAELLDDGRFADWLEIFDEDLTYWAPLRTNRLRRQAALSIGSRGEAAYFDETKESLAWRIRRYDSGMAWAEDPPSRTRHLVSNVTVRHLGGNEVKVRSAFLVYRNRLQTETDIYAGGRTDILRIQPDGGFRISSRELLFDANVLQAKNLSTFF
ncbi:aromatic-ring-hydroxylating dioxygenase subunit beta [Pseudarthrobacter sp. J75]|uniref:aromatic-ring-hydroxylating dioxygenase subunit beta n=1 Tax=unclassified Pseudarthrobacter TaxID=2647000 RepID=UPI002E7FD595|nr:MULTISPECIES: aromatic-ring-hydroxylating dioxygenase subunit beta [unclassified Pseudarthrobacter]MEE2523642.1 aromatic-ring-hydroxylating dioxygenase subunit beta [Pseudarthrobacter sp. J47]MEE2530032.1 aromatic-ring-hydroxylating dioxygenase subunit beta [Pseudarthrobacter sp. J75]MEE2570558.1 aromatic-ring-hydroxylating dioxygenase subunit beta [Pseudarthrobacter sp. J64]